MDYHARQARLAAQLHALRVDALLITHLPSQVHLKIRSETTQAAVFAFDDPTQLDWLERLQLDRETIRTLPKYDYLWKARGKPARLIHA